MELVLEPNSHPAVKTYQEAIDKDGIPATSFATNNIQEVVEKLTDLCVVFTPVPTEMGGTKIAVSDHTCGNLIQIYQIES